MFLYQCETIYMTSNECIDFIVRLNFCFKKTTDKRTKKRESLVIIYKKVLNISINKTVT